MTHNFCRIQCDVVAGLDLLALREPDGVFLGDFLYESLRILYHGRLLVLESRRVRSRQVLELSMESILASGTRRRVGAVLCGDGKGSRAG